MDIKLPYGIKNGELVTIDEVERGLLCNCSCPNCNATLIARKGNLKTHHFAHFNTPECKGAVETEIHKICKEIIYNSNSFLLPAYKWKSGRVIEDEYVISDYDVNSEKRLDNIIPDIIIEKGGKKLLVEIEFTNPVTYDKLEKIKSLKLSAIAIDVKYMVNYLFTKRDFRLKDDQFADMILNSTRYKRWLHNEKLYLTRFVIKNGIQVPKGVEKVVQTFEGDFDPYFHFVKNCPLNKRQWQNGYNKGKSYATIEDCQACKYSNEIINGLKLKDDRFLDDFPGIVYCLGQDSKHL